MLTVLLTELAKLRRSKVTWLSLLGYALGPLAGALFTWIALEPGRAARLGLLGTKANLAGLQPTWVGYFSLLTQVSGLGGMILVAVIASYVFGREYTEGTAKNMLALPVPRHRFAAAKFTVVFLWFSALTGIAVVETVGLGIALGLPAPALDQLGRGAGDVALASAVAFLLVPVVAWIATFGRGYLPPLGFAIVTLILGNVLGATGWGKWFPWSIVPLFAGVAGPRAETLATGSLLVLALTFTAGVAATVAQLRFADCAQ